MNTQKRWNIIEWVSIFIFYILIIIADIKILDYGKRIVEMKEYYFAIAVMVLFLLIPKDKVFREHLFNKNTVIKISLVIFSYIIYLVVAMALVMLITQESI